MHRLSFNISLMANCHETTSCNKSVIRGRFTALHLHQLKREAYYPVSSIYDWNWIGPSSWLRYLFFLETPKSSILRNSWDNNKTDTTRLRTTNQFLYLSYYMFSLDMLSFMKECLRIWNRPCRPRTVRMNCSVPASHSVFTPRLLFTMQQHHGFTETSGEVWLYEGKIDWCFGNPGKIDRAEFSKLVV